MAIQVLSLNFPRIALLRHPFFLSTLFSKISVASFLIISAPRFLDLPSSPADYNVSSAPVHLLSPQSLIANKLPRSVPFHSSPSLSVRPSPTADCKPAAGPCQVTPVSRTGRWHLKPLSNRPNFCFAWTFAFFALVFGVSDPARCGIDIASSRLHTPSCRHENQESVTAFLTFGWKLSRLLCNLVNMDDCGLLRPRPVINRND